MSTPTTDQLHQAILAAMEKETRRIVEEEAAAAAQRTEQRVRNLAGEIATRVASFVHFDRIGQEIRITVRLPDRDHG